jgi:hypothetical protein
MISKNYSTNQILITFMAFPWRSVPPNFTNFIIMTLFGKYLFNFELWECWGAAFFFFNTDIQQGGCPVEKVEAFAP